MSELSSSQQQALQPVVYELGATVYLCQQFETSLLFLLSILTAHEGVVTAESFKEGVVTYSEKTLGQLAKSFKTKLKLPENYEIFIREGVDVRNRVVHGFVLRNSHKFLTDQGRTELIDELRAAQHVIDERQISVQRVLDRALQLFGGSLEQIRKEKVLRFERDAI
ncbi:MAG: hypothetical protein HY799_00375 [Nitrosomonadales bacterium]|nr:hypothetical protein [Nitrosomonadales bacterium]